MNGKNLDNGLKPCRNCGILFKGNKTLKNYCSELCREQAYVKKKENESQQRIQKLNDRFEGKQEGIDFIVCPICSQKVREISLLHAKQHGFSSPKSLAVEYNLETTKCANVKQNMTGKNNPAYNHGGKFSSWSSKSQYHTTEQIDKSKQKAKKNRVGKTPNYFEYWLNNCNGDVDKAKLKYAEHQSNGLTKMIKLYGEVEGLQRWKDRQERWLKNFPRLNYSKISQELFWNIVNTFNKSSFVFATRLEDGSKSNDLVNRECRLVLDTKVIMPDFIDLETKRIIEFDGEYWHGKFNKANPERERKREEILVKNGYKVMRVFEPFYIKDKQKVIQQCINFLKQ
ncbi:MAG: DUF559 domain-containing protein [Richelia sp. RM2_1_2]|nr:DUF559 domain-containing protein [Richelia sp. RM2_1_2]